MTGKDFRFYDSRQKYLLFVTTTNEKNKIAESIQPIISSLKPKQPALKIFDAGLGDGSLLMNVLRQCHQKFPNIPQLISGKEISMEDVRLTLEKLPDRFIEHQKMVFVVSNLHYSEAAGLTSKNIKKQKKINWMTVKLKGNSSLEFNNQLRDIEKKVAKNWQVERHPKSGNPTYKQPSVLVIYREDQEFVLKNIIPTIKNPENKFDLILASQPYRSRIEVGKKVNYVIKPMIKALSSKGQLLIVHAAGRDPANKIIKKLWPKDNPFPSLSKEIIDYLKKNVDKNLLKDINILPSKKIKYSLRALPNEISNGISTSIIFSAWNAATYVNQVNDIDILDAEKSKDYDKIVRKIVKQNKGLWFNNELLRIVRK